MAAIFLSAYWLRCCHKIKSFPQLASELGDELCWSVKNYSFFLMPLISTKLLTFSCYGISCYNRLYPEWIVRLLYQSREMSLEQGKFVVKETRSLHQSFKNERRRQLPILKTTMIFSRWQFLVLFWLTSKIHHILQRLRNLGPTRPLSRLELVILP